MESARLLALEALLKVNYNKGYSNIVIDKYIKKSGLSKKDISFLTALFYGVLERKITLNYIISQYSKISLNKMSPEVLEILRIGFYQILYMDKIPPSAAVNECVNLAKVTQKSKATGFINGMLRTFLRNNKKFKLPDSEYERLSVEYSCPTWIIDLFLKSYGKENTVEVLKCFSGRPPVNIRVNTLKTCLEDLEEMLNSEGVKTSKSNIINNALELSLTGQIDRLESFKKGLFHVQDVASQVCCKILDPKPGQVVMDVCAAPGGKTFTLAELMQNKGKVMAFDKYDTKVKLIESGAERLGISIITAGKKDAQQSSVSLDKVDKVLCDVPCSGLGIIRRKPEIRDKKQSLISGLYEVQYDILCKSAKLLKPGGTLVYSTCTLNPSENNNIADKFLLEHSDEYEPKAIDCERLKLKRNAFDKENQLTLMPHIHGTDGFFIAAFKKVR